jgi:hypothetical protein
VIFGSQKSEVDCRFMNLNNSRFRFTFVLICSFFRGSTSANPESEVNCRFTNKNKHVIQFKFVLFIECLQVLVDLESEVNYRFTDKKKPVAHF